jgi:uncharacterized membrane protein YphA (DoxX/SURF4 family)
MNRLIAALHHFWFAPAPAHPLALLRMALCAHMVYTMLPVDISRLRATAGRPIEMMEASVVLNLLPIPYPLPGAWLTVFALAMAATGLLAAVGLFTRPALLLFGLGYLYMGAVISSWGYVTHSRILPVHTLFILAAAPGATSWSVDRLLRWAWKRRTERGLPLRSALAGSPVPRWGMQLVVVVLVAIMFSAGLSKLRHGGWEWADGKTLGFYLSGGAVAHVLPPDWDPAVRPNRWRDGTVPLVPARTIAPEAAWKDGVGLDGYLYLASGFGVGQRLHQFGWALILLSVFTLVVELAAPVALLGSRARTVYLLAAMGLLLGIRLTMGPDFASWIVIGVCLLNWRWLASPVLVPLRKLRAPAVTMEVVRE